MECKVTMTEVVPHSYSGLLRISVTRLGDLLNFGQLFKACGNNYCVQIAHILGHFCECVKKFPFLMESLLSNFYKHLATFYWSHCFESSHQATGRVTSLPVLPPPLNPPPCFPTQFPHPCVSMAAMGPLGHHESNPSSHIVR